MTIEDKIRQLATEYRLKLQQRVEERAKEMQQDDNAHYLIYRVLGVNKAEGASIDLYQNKGRFLYRSAGGFLERATKLCFQETFPNAESLRIPNTQGRRPKSFEIDCLVDADAYEIKWRDATTDGDHITKEHTRMKVVAEAGYRPIRIMYYYPNRQQAQKIQAVLADLYKSVGGLYFYGDAAWRHLADKTGTNLKQILEKIAETQD